MWGLLAWSARRKGEKDRFFGFSLAFAAIAGVLRGRSLRTPAAVVVVVAPLLGPPFESLASRRTASVLKRSWVLWALPGKRLSTATVVDSGEETRTRAQLYACFLFLGIFRRTSLFSDTRYSLVLLALSWHALLPHDTLLLFEIPKWRVK